jgi:hypothetical protein
MMGRWDGMGWTMRMSLGTNHPVEMEIINTGFVARWPSPPPRSTATAGQPQPSRRSTLFTHPTMVRNIQSSILSYINPQNALSGPSNTRPPSTVSPITPARPQSSLIHSSPYIPKRMNARIKVSEDELQSDDSEALSRIKMEEHKSRPYDEEPVDLVQRPMSLIEKREAKRRVLDSDDDAQAEDQVIILSDSEEDEWDTPNYTGRTKQPTGKYQRPSYYLDTNQSEHEEAINIALPSTKRKIHIQSDEEDEFLPDINTLISETPTRAAIPQTPNNGRITRSTDNPSSTRTTRATRAAQSRLVVTPPPPSSSLRQTIDGIFVPPTPSDRDSYSFSPRAAAATGRWRKSGIAVSSSPEIRNTRRRNLRSDNGKTVEMGSSLTSLVGVGGKAQTRSTRMSNKRVETGSKAANGLVDEVEDEAHDGDSDDNLVLKKGFSSRRGISNGEQLDPGTTEETSSRRTRSARVGKPPSARVGLDRLLSIWTLEHDNHNNSHSPRSLPNLTSMWILILPKMINL